MMKFLSVFLITIAFISCTKEVIQQKLTVSVTPLNGGSVTPPTNSYDRGSIVSMVAIPSREYTFKEWQGSLAGSNNPAPITMDMDKDVTGVFEKRKYPLTITIEGNGTIKEEVIAMATNSQYPSGTTVRLTPQPLEGWAFSSWSGDLTSSVSPLDIKIDKPLALKATFNKIQPVSISLNEFTPQLTISNELNLGVNIILADKSVLKNVINYEISQTGGSGKVTIVKNAIIGAISGDVTLKIKYEAIEKNITLTVTSIEEIKEIDSYLKTAVSGAKINVPVIIINYYATNNGIDIDTKKQPSFGSLDPITIKDLKSKTLDELRLTKFGIEEGSKFRGFSNATSVPNVGIQVVKYYNVYEVKRVLTSDKVTYFTDFNDMFSRLNLKDVVNNLGVKEIWFSLRPLSGGYPVVKTENLSSADFNEGGPESNMSSPTSGDVSNSYRTTNDLPIYNKTYVVYTYNLHRSHAENIHNHGHQIEAQLGHMDEGSFAKDESLFLNKFVGISNLKYAGKPFGRNGMTHFPPNTTKDYDWNNATVVKSDIENWSPDGGIFKDINNKRWMDIKYNYPAVSYKVDENDAQYKWIMFWFQTIPGLNNGIKSGNSSLTNWWDILYNWDSAILSKKKLKE